LHVRQGWNGDDCVPTLRIGLVSARPYMPLAVTASALERFNPPGSPAFHHKPNLMATATSLLPARLEVHHWLPRQFEEYFESKGLKINDYTTKVPFSEHRGTDHRALLLHGEEEHTVVSAVMIWNSVLLCGIVLI
jgi:hypothetical protein